jgi:hypothetical protein
MYSLEQTRRFLLMEADWVEGAAGLASLLPPDFLGERLGDGWGYRTGELCVQFKGVRLLLVVLFANLPYLDDALRGEQSDSHMTVIIFVLDWSSENDSVAIDTVADLELL